MNNTPALFQDKLLRKIVVGSTGLGIALMLASVAAVQIGRTRGLEFAWHWSIAVVMVVGLIWNSRFWNVIWQIQDHPTSKLKRKVVVYFVALAALGLGTFLYPIRFVSAEYHLGISRGLVTAVLFLGVMGGIIYAIGRGIVKTDEVELNR